MFAWTEGFKAGGADRVVPALEPSFERTSVRPAPVRVEAVDTILPADRSSPADVPVHRAWRGSVAPVVFLDALDDQLSCPALASGIRENARPGCPVDDGRGHAQPFHDLSLRMVNGQTSDLCSTALYC